MHKVFISFHHENDQLYKEELLTMNDDHEIFIDQSVDTGDVSDDLDDEAIREKIRDEYLRDSSVTILLVGGETKKRKHVDWEIYSSMYNGKINKQSGILVLNLPTSNSTNCRASHKGEKERVYPETKNWINITERSEYESRYPNMPARIIDNLLINEVNISIANWSKIEDDPDTLTYLIDATFKDRATCKYDLSSPMRRKNS